MIMLLKNVTNLSFGFGGSKCLASKANASILIQNKQKLKKSATCVVSSILGDGFSNCLKVLI